MAKKPAVAFAIARKTYSNDFELFEITKDSPSGKIVYGRGADGEPTSRSGRDVKGRFATREAAQAALGVVQTIQRHHDPIVRDTSNAHTRALRERHEAIETALRELRISTLHHGEPTAP